MDNSENNIDQIFKARFTDAKDFSLDPKVVWQSVESSLSATPSVATGASASGFSKLALLKMAAVFAGSLTLAGVLESDKTPFSNQPDSHTVLHLSYISQEAKSELTNDFDTSIRAANLLEPTLIIVNEQIGDIEHITTPMRNANISSNTETAFVSDEFGTVGTSAAKSRKISFIDTSSYNSSKRSRISKMDLLALEVNNASVLVNAELVEPEIVAWKSNHMWFLRAGLRVGSGESNSFEIESEWKANPSFSFGYGFSLSDNSYITAELGWLRRSGNGIERTKDVDLNPLINGITLSLGESLSDNDLVIHESLVASRMDYIHMPINYHRQLAEKWTLSVGGFVDLLISAKNDGYIVYNNTEYQASIAGKSELSSFDGLNRVRYGAMIGAERNVFGNVSAFGQMMVPLNLAVDTKSEYHVIDETNRLVDLKIGLTYRI